MSLLLAAFPLTARQLSPFRINSACLSFSIFSGHSFSFSPPPLPLVKPRLFPRPLWQSGTIEQYSREKEEYFLILSVSFEGKSFAQTARKMEIVDRLPGFFGLLYYHSAAQDWGTENWGPYYAVQGSERNGRQPHRRTHESQHRNFFTSSLPSRTFPFVYPLLSE